MKEAYRNKKGNKKEKMYLSWREVNENEFKEMKEGFTQVEKSQKLKGK